MKIWIGQALLGHLDSWSKFTLQPKVVESYYLSNFGFSNEEMDPKIRIYAKNWARQVLFENFDFWSRFMQKSTFRNWAVCTIPESWMKKRIPKSKNTRKTEWDKPILKILTFWSKSKFKLGQSFFFFFFIFCRRFGPNQWTGQTGSAWTNGSDRSGEWRHHSTGGARVSGPCWHVWAREMTLVITEPSCGAWRHVSGLLDLKFSGLVDLRPWKTLVLSVF